MSILFVDRINTCLKRFDSIHFLRGKTMFTLEQFLKNTTWNPALEDAGEAGKKILHMRLQVKPGTTADNLNITLNGHDLRVNFENKGQMDEFLCCSIPLLRLHCLAGPEYKQVTIWPTADLDQLKTELKSDGYLHITVPIRV